MIAAIAAADAEAPGLAGRRGAACAAAGVRAAPTALAGGLAQLFKLTRATGADPA